MRSREKLEEMLDEDRHSYFQIKAREEIWREMMKRMDK